MSIWTEDEVASANGFQECGCFHPYTCGNGCGDLRATVDGWVCDQCDYRQTTADGFMLHWGWKATADAMFPNRNKPREESP
jgi:hypothetical protein